MGRPALYPWDEWGDGRRWMLTEGEDFQVDRKSFRAAAYQAARFRGKVCKSRLHGDTDIELQFIDPRPPRRADNEQYVRAYDVKAQGSTLAAEDDHGR